MLFEREEVVSCESQEITLAHSTLLLKRDETVCSYFSQLLNPILK
jgi:hypothetical protein